MGDSSEVTATVSASLEACDKMHRREQGLWFAPCVLSAGCVVYLKSCSQVSPGKLFPLVFSWAELQLLCKLSSEVILGDIKQPVGQDPGEPGLDTNAHPAAAHLGVCPSFLSSALGEHHPDHCQSRHHLQERAAQVQDQDHEWAGQQWSADLSVPHGRWGSGWDQLCDECG